MWFPMPVIGGISMIGSSFGYLLKTGFKNVYMNRLMSFASIGVLAACLMLIGSGVRPGHLRGSLGAGEGKVGRQQ